MRIWEFEDNKSASTDLVHEQDFILRVRRLQRLGTPHFVVNLALNAIESLAQSRQALEAMQDKIREFTKVTNGAYAEMSNGDVFIVWDDTAATRPLAERLVAVLVPEGTPVIEAHKFLFTYTLPADYTPLRERTNYYVEAARASALVAGDGAPSEALKSSARGPLTAWSVDQIGKLLNDIDLRRYARTQPIYRVAANGGWEPVSEEHFVSFDELRRERFPRIDIITPEHLFLALCETLDQRFLAQLTQFPQSIAGKNVHMNLSVSSILGSVFAQFTHSVPKGERGRVCFELHRGDLLQDFERTLGAIEVLRAEGFKVALDGITPDMINYLTLPAFNADYFKINVSRDRAALLGAPAIRKGLAQIAPEKLIFFRCDNDRALEAGRELGIGLFQGWLIDDIVHGKPKS